MRGSRGEDEFERQSERERFLQLFKTYVDAVFGQAMLMQAGGGVREYLLVRERTFDSREAARQFVALTAAALQLEHPYLLGLLDYSASAHRSLCAKRYTVRQLYPFPRSDLRREIDRRAQEGRPFAIAEMVHLLYQLVEVNAYLQARKTPHGALSPAAVGLQGEGEFALKLKLLSDERPGPAAAREARLRDFLAKRSLYVSPGYFRCIVKGREFGGDPCVEDVFAAGLVVLEAGVLKSPAHIYLADGEVDREGLQRLLEEFKSRYAADSTLLVSVLENMLQPGEDRPTFQDLKDNMPNYAEIRAFLAESAPRTLSASRSFDHRAASKTLARLE